MLLAFEEIPNYNSPYLLIFFYHNGDKTYDPVELVYGNEDM